MRKLDNVTPLVERDPTVAQARIWVPAHCFFSREDAQRHCWLWLLGGDGLVRALLAPAHQLGHDKLLPDLLKRFADPNVVTGAAVVNHDTIALPNAPIVPLPRWSVSWGHPVQRGIRAFANALDADVIEVLGNLEVQGACFGTVHNYNQLTCVPTLARARRLQALELFPAWLAPALLDPITRPQMFDDQEDDNDRYWRHRPAPLHGLLAARCERRMSPHALNALFDAIDQGRDLIGAIANFYRIDRALVRAPLGREPWHLGAMPEVVVSLLHALPAHARPRQRKEVEPRLAAIDALPARLRSPADVSRLAGAFKHGWNDVWKTCERAHPNLPQALRDCQDFLNAALATPRQLPEHVELDVHRLALAWVARKGVSALLEASRHWHALPVHAAPPPTSTHRDEPLVPLFGELALTEGRARELLTADALFEEGAAMAHCVADYWHFCRADGIRIVHLETLAGEMATLELGFDVEGRSTEIRNDQLRGRFNADPSPAVEELAEAVLAKLDEQRDIVRNQMTLIREQVRVFTTLENRPRIPPPMHRQLDARLRTQLAHVLAYAAAQDDWRRPADTALRGSVAGFQYGRGEEVFDALCVGDALSLVREPDNPHDPRAIRIDWNGIKLGYVPRADNARLARLLDRGGTVTAKIHALTDDEWAPVEFLVEVEIE